MHARDVSYLCVTVWSGLQTLNGDDDDDDDDDDIRRKIKNSESDICSYIIIFHHFLRYPVINS